VLVCSDGVSEGTREDRAGPKVVERLVEAGFAVIDHRVCADGIDAVAFALRDLATGFAGLVVTTGGTGFGPRDLTPEGTRMVIDREARLAEGAAAQRHRGSLGMEPGRVRHRWSGAVCNLPGSSSGDEAST
jgi:molybdopterin biosynthesis enzyme MoaB